MRRHPDLTIKLAENTKRIRAGLSYGIIEEYFRNPEQTIVDVPASNSVNYDEINFVDKPGSFTAVTRGGAKNTYRTIDISKSTLVMIAIEADDTYYRPM